MELNELVELITKLVKEKLEALEAAGSKKIECVSCRDSVMEMKEKVKAEEIKRYVLDKKVITEADIQKLARQGIKELVIGKKAIVTPLAQDSIKIYTIKLIKE